MSTSILSPIGVILDSRHSTQHEFSVKQVAKMGRVRIAHATEGGWSKVAPSRIVSRVAHIALAFLLVCSVPAGAAAGSAAAPCEAVMTDTDNTGTKAVGHYADIRFECAGG